MARPSKYSQKLADAICSHLADGKSMRAICKLVSMPDRRTIERWQAADADFAARCAHAREEQAEFHHAEMDVIEGKVLSGKLDPKAASVVLANKRWRMEKLKPKAYGQRIQQELSGAGGGPIETTVTAVERRIVRPADRDS